MQLITALSTLLVAATATQAAALDTRDVAAFTGWSELNCAGTKTGYHPKKANKCHGLKKGSKSLRYDNNEDKCALWVAVDEKCKNLVQLQVGPSAACYDVHDKKSFMIKC